MGIDLLKLLGQGMQPGALDRLAQKINQTKGSDPMPSGIKSGYRGNLGALSTQKPRPFMYRPLRGK